MKSLKAFLALLGLSVLTLACNPFGGEGDINITNTNTNTNEQNPAPVPSPSASPSPGAGAAVPIVALKITFFPDAPGSGNKILLVGEKSTITASPQARDANGNLYDPCKGIDNSLCASYSQADIAWDETSEGVSGEACADPPGASTPVVQATDAGEEAYNRDLRACKAGSFTVRATLKGTIEGALVGSVEAAPQ